MIVEAKFDLLGRDVYSVMEHESKELMHSYGTFRSSLSALATAQTNSSLAVRRLARLFILRCTKVCSILLFGPFYSLTWKIKFCFRGKTSLYARNRLTLCDFWKSGFSLSHVTTEQGNWSVPIVAFFLMILYLILYTFITCFVANRTRRWAVRWKDIPFPINTGWTNSWCSSRIDDYFRKAYNLFLIRWTQMKLY